MTVEGPAARRKPEGCARRRGQRALLLSAATAAVLALSPAQGWVLPSPPQQACQPQAAVRRPASSSAAGVGPGSWLLDPIRCRSGGGRGAAVGGWARVGGRVGRLWAVDVDTETKEGAGDGASGGGGGGAVTTTTTAATTTSEAPAQPRMPMTQAEKLQLQAQMLKLQAEKLRLEAEREQIQVRWGWVCFGLVWWGGVSCLLVGLRGGAG